MRITPALLAWFLAFPLGCLGFSGNPGFSDPGSAVAVHVQIMEQSPDTSESSGKDAIPSALSGTYTIGGASADFVSLQDALDTMSLQGLSGPVIFEVMPNAGPYTGGLTLGSYPGVSNQNTITFNGNGNVIKDTTATFILAFDGAMFITLNGFQIINTQPVLNKIGILIRGGSAYLNIVNNYIDVGMLSSNPLSSAGIAMSASYTSAQTAGNNGNFINVIDNEIVGGNYGISMVGQFPYLNCTGNLVANNVLRDFNMYGVYLRDVDTAWIVGNEIHRANRITSASFYGIFLSYCRNTKVHKNRIHSSGAGSVSVYPLYLSVSVNSPGYETEFANNAVYNLPASGSHYGLTLGGSGTSRINVHYNTFHLLSEANNQVRALYVTSPIQQLAVFNNIFSIQGSGAGSKHGIYITSSSTAFSSDYNDVYVHASAGANHVGYLNGSLTGLADWQSASLQDLHSLSVDPDFIAPDNFMAHSHLLLNAGIPIPHIMDDIFGTLRDTAAPCIGAYEYVGLTHDLAVVAMIEPGTVCPGVHAVKVLVKNWGIQAVQGFTIHWEVNGIAQDSLPDTCLINPGATCLVDLGNHPFVEGAVYNLLFYTHLPGGQPDQDPLNDTLLITGFETAMHGSYSVGPSALHDFSSLQHVADALMSRGVCGPVTIDLSPGSGPYQGGVEFGKIPGSSDSNTVTFLGNNSVLHQGIPGFILKFDGTAHLTLDHLHLFNTDSSRSIYGIEGAGAFSFLTISHCTIDVGILSTSGGGPIYLYHNLGGSTASNTSGSFIDITGNVLIGGQQGIFMNSLPSGYLTRGHHIQGNLIANFLSTGVNLYRTKDIRVQGNEISRPSRQTQANFSGIHISEGNRFKINDNIIRMPGKATVEAYGIRLNYGTGFTQGRSELINNLIGLEANSSMTGVYLSMADSVDILHNTIRLETKGSGQIRTLVLNTTIQDQVYKNNIFSIEGKGNSTRRLIFSNVGLGGSSIYSDRNAFYMDTLEGNNVFAVFDTLLMPGIMDWQNTSYQDSGSIFTNPYFSYPQQGNLTPLSNTIDDIGLPVGLLYDVFGNPRSLLSPDPGAIEFTGLSSDLAIADAALRLSYCFNVQDTVVIELSNIIGDTVDFAAEPLYLSWIVDGPQVQAGTAYLNSGLLPPGANMQVKDTNIMLSEPGLYYLSAFLLPSNRNLFAGNDTLENTFEQMVQVPFEIIPTSSLVTNPSEVLKVHARSMYFPPGPFFITEMCHEKMPPGEPVGGWPDYLLANNYIEITGVPYANLHGYTLEQWRTGMIRSFTFGPSTVLSPSGTAIIGVGMIGYSVARPAEYYYHGISQSIGFFPNEALGRILKDPAGNIVDAVGYGNYSFPGYSGVTTAHWSGQTQAAAGAGIRLEGPYTKDATYWISSSTSPQDPNALNQLVTLPSLDSLTGLTWSIQGIFADSNVATLVPGLPYPAAATWQIAANYTSACGILSDTIYVGFALFAMLDDTTLCAGDTATLSFYLPGIPPWTIVLSNGTGLDTLSGILNSPFKIGVGPLSTTIYEWISYWDSSQMVTPANLTVTISVNPAPIVSLDIVDTVCVNQTPFLLTGGLPSGGTYSGSGLSNGYFFPLHANLGMNYITYTYTTAEGCTGSDIDSIFVDYCMGQLNVEAGHDVMIYPNPARDFVHIDLVNLTLPYTARVFNGLGQDVSNSCLYGTGSPGKHVIDFSGFSPGVYFLRIAHNKGTLSRKLILLGE